MAEAALHAGTPSVGNMPKDKEKHCPFGCELEQLDDLGYCRHLMGFTNGGDTFEPLVPMLDRRGEPNGFYRVRGGKAKETLLPGDRLVNPEYWQVNKGIRSLVKTWVSARVYRKEGRQEAPEISE